MHIEYDIFSRYRDPILLSVNMTATRWWYGHRQFDITRGLYDPKVCF